MTSHLLNDNVGDLQMNHIPMMRLPFIMLFSMSVYGCFGQFFSWAQHVGGVDSEQALSCTTDQFGNVFVLGSFRNTTDLDPGPGQAEFHAVVQDVSISKYNPHGDLLWVKVIAGTWHVLGADLTLDARGNIYVVGYIIISADLDPGPATDSLLAGDDPDAFVIKLDPQGDLIWRKSFDVNQSPVTMNVDIDKSGAVLISGQFVDSTDFDPGPDVLALHSLGINPFLLKLSATGDLVWVKKMVSHASIQDFITDPEGNVYLTGEFFQQMSIETDTGLYSLTAVGNTDIFFGKMDSQGAFVWMHSIGGTQFDGVHSIDIDRNQNLYLCGEFHTFIDFDPGMSLHTATSNGLQDIFIASYGAIGEYRWSQYIGGEREDFGNDIVLDTTGNVYYTARFTRTIDLNPDPGVQEVTSAGAYDGIVSKLDPDGTFIWAFTIGGPAGDNIRSITLDRRGKILIAGSMSDTLDADPGTSRTILSSNGNGDQFMAAFSQQGIMGKVIFDTNENCVQDSIETGLWGQKGIILPADIVIETNLDGIWYIDSLPAGDYSIRFDTTDHWTPSCDDILNFTVTDPYHTEVEVYGMKSTNPCPLPEVSVIMPAMRPCFDNQSVNVRVCNLENATGPLVAGTVTLTLDSLLLIQNVDVPHIMLDSHTTMVAFDTLFPGACFSFSTGAMLRCGTELGTTLCMEAKINTVDSCVYNTPHIVFGPDLPSCVFTQDFSHIVLSGWCSNDSVFFLVENTAAPGIGDMQCNTPTRLFIDGQWIREDSILLSGEERRLFIFSGDGRTWRMEVDQSIYHPGFSNPSATIEACGNMINWTPGLVNIFPPDDAEVTSDIYCGEVTGSYDPNDKRGYPTGVGDAHHIAPDSRLEYIIRFQNTGTDTAFRVVIRDTLPSALDILSVVPMSVSHAGYMRRFGTHILEWVFDAILLPDSNINEAASHGYISFSVDVLPGLTDGTIIENTAAIYFDFNPPVITSPTYHTIHSDVLRPSWNISDTTSLKDCYQVQFDGYNYDHSGIYYHVWMENNVETLFTINVRILTEELDESVFHGGHMLISEANDVQYQWIRCSDGSPVAGAMQKEFAPSVSGSYAVIISTEGCSDTSACLEVLITSTENRFTEELIRIHPNPTTGEFTLSIPRLTGPVHITVADIMGEPVLSQSHESSKDITIRLPDRTGIYIVTITSGVDRAVTRVVRADYD